MPPNAYNNAISHITFQPLVVFIPPIMHTHANSHISQTGTSALFFAAQGGYIEIVKLLLEKGAAIDVRSYVSQALLKITSPPQKLLPS